SLYSSLSAMIFLINLSAPSTRKVCVDLISTSIRRRRSWNYAKTRNSKKFKCAYSIACSSQGFLISPKNLLKGRGRSLYDKCDAQRRRPVVREQARVAAQCDSLLLEVSPPLCFLGEELKMLHTLVQEYAKDTHELHCATQLWVLKSKTSIIHTSSVLFACCSVWSLTTEGENSTMAAASLSLRAGETRQLLTSSLMSSRRPISHAGSSTGCTLSDISSNRSSSDSSTISCMEPGPSLMSFSAIPQNISEASCATQYKMAVEGVSSGSCGEVNMFLHDNSGDEQPYIHLNDNFYPKFKIDPNELYTFHDSDVIAGEITVSHTDDNFMFSDSVDIKSKLLADSPSKELDLIGAFTNGDIKEDIKKEVVSNGHYPPVAKPIANYKDSKTTHTKVLKVKNQTQMKEPPRLESFSEPRRLSVHSPKAQCTATAPSSCAKTSINSASTTNNAKTSSKQMSGMETFLDVFKREQGLVENASALIKTEPSLGQPLTKVPMSPPKKSSSAKPRRGRGPAVHEALQRIPAARRAVPLPNDTWHAPGETLFQCGPLGDRPLAFRQIESSSSDDDNMPDFEAGCVSACVEESAAESRGARLALRRAALRRHVARAHDALALAAHHKHHRALASLLKKQLNRPGSSGRLPTQTVNHLLALRGMPSVLTSQERRILRQSGWSGGEASVREGGTITSSGSSCVWERCEQPALPCARYCLAHVTRAPEQRLYAACGAVFAGGARCNQPLLPLSDHTPLCAEHAWKRDNYDKLARDCRPKKVARKRPCPPVARGPRRAKRRRRPPARLRPPTADSLTGEQSLSELNVCSNSSTYDSSEEAAMGALSESEYVAVASDSHEMEVEVGQVPPDDILDPAVLSQIPDEAFTEFFNQAEGGAAFAESSELAAALEAVLDERVLDERVLDERVLDERALDSIADCNQYCGCKGISNQKLVT
ncbi:hypothetical protein HW555_007932, partial [Spodoptera exigua]